tara:strand:- start:945 stop:2249 length:1305 start_codon:yes stop_codon:yes gene_type:complete
VVNMSLLFKAELHGHKEPMAQAAFVMDDLKKGLSEEIMDLFRRNRIGIEGDITEIPIDGNWKKTLGKFPDLEEDIPRTTTGKKDWGKLITSFTNWIEILDDWLDQEASVKEIVNNPNVEGIPGIHLELVEGFKQNENIFKRIQSARRAMNKLIPRLEKEASKEGKKHWEKGIRTHAAIGRKQFSRRNKKGEKAAERRSATTPLRKRLKELLIEFSKDDRIEYIDENITTLDRDYKFFDQSKLSTLWEKYDKGKLNPNIFAVLNDEYNGEKGITLLKKIVEKLNLSTKYVEDTKFNRHTEYALVDLKRELNVLSEILDDDANIETTRQLFSNKKYPLTKIEDISDKLELRMYNLDEGDEPVYSYEDDEEINEDIRNTEMSKLVNYYSLLYYVADLRGKKLNKKMLNWDEHEIEVETLPERFPIITDTYNSLQEEE